MLAQLANRFTQSAAFKSQSQSSSCISQAVKQSTPCAYFSKRVIVQSRAKRGLFGGKHIQFGNNVSHSHRKTRRTWSPNIQKKYYYSDLLEKEFHLQVTCHAMRCIDKAGGFDAYIVKSSRTELGEGTAAAKIRQQIEKKYSPIKSTHQAEMLLVEMAKKRITPTPEQAEATLQATLNQTVPQHTVV